MNQMKNHGTINVRLDMDALYGLMKNLTSIWSGKILYDLTVCSQPWVRVFTFQNSEHPTDHQSWAVPQHSR